MIIIYLASIEGDSINLDTLGFLLDHFGHY